MAVIGLPTTNGVAILASGLRENVKKFALWGTTVSSDSVPFSEDSTLSSLNAYLVGEFDVGNAYFDTNGVLTFECPIPLSVDSNRWVSAAGLIYVNQPTGAKTLVSVTSLPKFQKASGIGGNIAYKVPVKGSPSSPIFGDMPYIDESKFSEYVNSRDAVILEALSLAGLANREIERTLKIRNQSGTAIIRNLGVISGVSAEKSSTATRNINISSGSLFLNGRRQPIRKQPNTANIPSNNSAETKYSYLYAYLTGDGLIDISATLLGEMPPADAITLYRVTVPSGNTEATDPYLVNCTITDVSRRESTYPRYSNTSAGTYVALPYALPDNKYQVDVEIASFEGPSLALGDVTVGSKSANGFQLSYNGLCDNISVGWKVQRL